MKVDFPSFSLELDDVALDRFQKLHTISRVKDKVFMRGLCSYALPHFLFPEFFPAVDWSDLDDIFNLMEVDSNG